MAGRRTCSRSRARAGPRPAGDHGRARRPPSLDSAPRRRAAAGTSAETASRRAAGRSAGRAWRPLTPWDRTSRRSADRRERLQRAELLDAPGHGGGELAKGRRLRRVGAPERDRHTGVAAGPRLGIKRNAREERHAVLVGDALAAGLAEDRGALAAVRAREDAHVPDDAGDRHVAPPEPRPRLAG